MNRLQGKIALVTGGNSGIGLATAQLFAQEGAQVIITGRNQTTLDDAARLIGPDTLAFRADVAKVEDIARLYQTVRQHVDHLDMVFANAGYASFFPASAATAPLYDELMDINVRGLYFSIQQALPLLAPDAAVVINSSSAWMKGLPNGTVYAATKAAVRSFARTFAAELLAEGKQVRVNVVSPGPIDTPIFERTGGMPAEAVPQLREAFTSLVPMRRFGTAQEVAQAVLFLASSESSYITGVDIPVDGGLSQL